MASLTTLTKRVAALEKNAKAIGKKVDSIDKNTKIQMKTLATAKDLQSLQESVEGVAELIKSFRIGVHVSGRIFGISGKVILYVGALCTSILAIYVGAKWLFGVAVVKLFSHLP